MYYGYIRLYVLVSGTNCTCVELVLIVRAFQCNVIVLVFILVAFYVAFILVAFYVAFLAMKIWYYYFVKFLHTRNCVKYVLRSF